MKLSKKNIGQLFDVEDSDGSWVYQLIDIKDGWLLFYDFHGGYMKERVGENADWRPFNPTKPWPKNWIGYGWIIARDK